MKRLDYRIRQLEQRTNHTNCRRCGGTGRPCIVDAPPRPTSFEEWQALCRWAREYRAERKRPEEWAVVAADGNGAVAQALAQILAEAKRG